jgi:HSP20 family molecular chaperone IbpA
MMERSSGQFVRRMELPDAVDQGAIKVEFRDGVLRVIIPKSKQPRGEPK